MENNLESLESRVNEMRTVFQEFGEKISRVMEMEKKKLREQTEEEARQIIARATEEANQYIVQARQESEKEADKFFDKIHEKAEQIIKESREEAIAEAYRESARIVNETREKVAQIISGVAESGLAQVQSEFNQIASEAKNKLESETTRLLTVTKNIEQIIDETQSSIQAGIDRLANIIRETGDKLHSLSEISPEVSLEIESQVDEETIEVKHIDTPENQKTAVGTVQGTAEAGIESAEKPEEQETRKMVQEGASAGITEAEKPESPGDADGQLQKGIALLDAKQTQEALGVFKEVTEIDPDNPLAWRKLGTTLAMLGRHTEALKALRRAIALSPKDITAWHNTEIILRELGQKKEAKEAREMEKQLIKQYPEQYKEVLKNK